jgi:hypothetical protein
MAPHDASVKAVRDWLSSHGIQAQTLVGMGDWLGFQTTVGKASELFDAEFWNFKHLDTGKEEVRTLAYSIPTEMKQHIELAHPMITYVPVGVHMISIDLTAIPASPTPTRARPWSRRRCRLPRRRCRARAPAGSPRRAWSRSTASPLPRLRRARRTQSPSPATSTSTRRARI